jgi:HEPN superfamily RiboL-PSP-like protein
MDAPTRTPPPKLPQGFKLVSKEYFFAFDENLKSVQRLLEIHKELGGLGPGRRHGLEVINHSAVVLVTACWEAYIEDIARRTFLRLLKASKNANSFPLKIRLRVSNQLRDSKDERKLWDLADEGWRVVLNTYLDNKIEAFHNPRTDNVNALFMELLDLKDLSASWKWRGMSSTQAGEKLNEIIVLRHKIAHRVVASAPIYNDKVHDYLRHVKRIAEKTDEAIIVYLQHQQQRIDS